jgi:hypothetical protein
LWCLPCLPTGAGCMAGSACSMHPETPVWGEVQRGGVWVWAVREPAKQHFREWLAGKLPPALQDRVEVCVCTYVRACVCAYAVCVVICR